MANVIVNLPLPALNGAGASVATTGMGAAKTFIVTGSFPGATIIIEASTDGGTVFTPVVVFQRGTNDTLVNVVADHMRARVSGRKTSVPFSAVVEVGAPGETPVFADIPMPTLNGPGTAVDISTFPLFATFIAGGSFAGCLITVEISDDNVDYAPLVAFSGQGGLASRLVTANWVRANVSGRKSSLPFSGSLSIGAAAPPGGGGGGGGGFIAVQQDGVDVVNPATAVDFQTPGTLVQDEGTGAARVYATLLPDTLNIITPTEGEQFGVEYGKTNVVNPNGINECFAVFPTPSSFPNGIPNGTLMAIKIIDPFVSEGATTGSVGFITMDADSIDLINAQFPGDFPITGRFSGQAFIFVFDGSSNWWYIGSTGGGTTNEQAFIYTATGGESSAGFDIAFPVDMPDTNYIALIELGSPTDQLTTAVETKFVDHITVSSSADPEAGDEFQVFLKAITGVLA